MYPYIIQGDNVTVVIDNKSHMISKTHISYQKVIDAIKANDWELVRSVIDPVKTVIEFGKGNVAIKGDTLFWKNRVLDTSLSRRIIQMCNEGFSVEPMVLFMENLMENPSNRAVNELYRFLENNNLPITPDGQFLAYKSIRDSYRDVHSNTVLNKPAHLFTDEDREAILKPMGKKDEVTVAIDNNVTVVSTNRNDVDDDMRNHCSYGLHICSREYLESFGGDRIIIVKVNPRDVVSIPDDYGWSKGRVCRYEVISELGVSADDAFTDAVHTDANVAE